jgi:hypothetical protein
MSQIETDVMAELGPPILPLVSGVFLNEHEHIVASRVANGWRKPAGFPHVGTLARGVGQITFGENI